MLLCHAHFRGKRRTGKGLWHEKCCSSSLKDGRYSYQFSARNYKALFPTTEIWNMALKIILKPGEKLIIGGAVITNGPHRTEFVVENNVPILRQVNILSPDEADTPARRIYLAIQLMYIDSSNYKKYQNTYWQLVREFVQAAPSSTGLVDKINEMIFQGNFYQALRLTQKLMEFEQEVLKRVTKCSEILPIG